MSDFSSFLFARPSFFEGAARAFDLGDTLTEYNGSATGEAADTVAISCDWRQVAEDIWRAMLRERAAGVQKIPSP